MILDCGCIENEDGQKTVFCRPCAASLPQIVEDDRGRWQLNPDWLQARCGFATGSRAIDITKLVQKKKEKGVVTEWKPSADRQKYMDHVIAERLTGRPQGIKKIYSLDERRDLEPEARYAYALFCNQDVREVGFIHHPFIEWFGCSPDLFAGDEGMGEIKCLDPSTHLKLLEGNESVIEEYIPQIRAGLACTSRAWCDFISYCPQMMGENEDLCVLRFERDEDHISRLECAVQQFLAEVDGRLRNIKERAKRGFIFLERENSNLLAQLTESVKMLDKSSVVRPMKRPNGKRQRSNNE